MSKLDIKIDDLTLPDGAKIPMLGYGTGTAWFKTAGNTSRDEALIEFTQTAGRVGLLHWDCAEMYNTEDEVGEAIKKSKIPREKLFITTKVAQSIDNVPAACDASLKRLGLSYVDLFLIHQPFFAKGDEKLLQQKWADMEEIAASGKARSIGVSNFSKQHLEAIYKTAKIRPSINQIEFHPYLQHGDLLDYQKNKDLRVAAYGSLLPITRAKGGPLDPLLDSLAKKYAVNTSEILLRWCIDRNVVVITTSSKEQRLSDYLRIFTFSLTPKEVEEISETGKAHHFRGFWTDKYDANDRS